MQLHDAHADYLRERYKFNEWQSGQSADTLTGDAIREGSLPGWHLSRTSRELLDDEINLTRTVWTRDPGNLDSMIVVEVFRCSSATRARQYLLQVLGDMQGPVAVRQTPPTVGEIAFALGANSATIFARANVVVRVRNGGRTVVDTAAEARAIDTALTRKR